MHVVGMSWNMPYAADRVLATFGDASESLCLRLHQTLRDMWRQSSKGYTPELEHYVAAVDAARYKTWLGSNRAYPVLTHIGAITLSKNYPHITALEVTVVASQEFDDPYCKSNSSKFTDGQTTWVCGLCVEYGFSGSLFLGQQEQLLSWKQLDTYNYFHCSCRRTIFW